MAKPKVKKGSAQSNGGPPLQLPDGLSRDLEPQLLLLDPHNLRLFELTNAGVDHISAKLLGQKAVQDKLYKTIWEYPLFDVRSLETSISYNGFLKHERLIVARYDADTFLVLEGNRRLTAVRHLFEQHGQELRNLSPNVRQSLTTLPCFVLNGDAIDGSEQVLGQYRRASEIYIGMRHLMGAKNWEPASRYEFQARLLEEGWSPSDVAERFGRKKYEVDRDLKAQRLYRDLRQFEHKNKISHSLTYNAFNEAARAPSIMRWLGWSSAKMAVVHKDREEGFFHYLISRLNAATRAVTEEGEEEDPDESAEKIVRRLRDMLKLGEPNIEDALVARDFKSADLLYEEKREGTFAKKIANYTRKLKTVSMDELSDSPQENKVKLTELIDQAKKIMVLLDALLRP